MAYVDGYILPVPKDKLDEYVKLAKTAGEVWLERGALEYTEWVGEDLDNPVVAGMTTFPQGMGIQPGETVIFSWIKFESREARDRINAAVLQDPRLKESMEANTVPFDCKRMWYGGFDELVAM